MATGEHDRSRRTTTRRRVGWQIPVAVIVALLGGLAVTSSSTVSAAEAPVLHLSSLHAVDGDSLTVTLTGCTGSAAPTIGYQTNVYVPSDGVPASVTQTTPGVWTAQYAVGSGGDVIFHGSCASGATATPVRVDVEWRESFTDPFFQTFGQLNALTGTDCAVGGTSQVWFRVGQREWLRSVTPDSGGDWRVPPPPVGPGHDIMLSAVCGGYHYIPTDWLTSRDAAHDRVPTFLKLDQPEGPPGTAFTGSVDCLGTRPPTVTALDVGDDAVRTVDVAEGPGGSWTFTGVGGRVDTTYLATCGGIHQSVRFDAIDPVITSAPSPLGGSPATRIFGTDCPGVAAPTVDISWAGGSVVDHPTVDVFGDWSVPRPAVSVPAPGGVEVTVRATCGSLVYDPLAYVEPGAMISTTTTTAPTPPSSAVPAAPVAGSPTFTG